MTFVETLQKLLKHESLTFDESREAFTALMRGEATPVQMAAFLTALRLNGESSEEIAGAAVAMRSAAVPISVDIPLLVDTCGTGGDGLGSFNVSTASAFVVAGAGLTVAKHGN